MSAVVSGLLNGGLASLAIAAGGFLILNRQHRNQIQRIIEEAHEREKQIREDLTSVVAQRELSAARLEEKLETRVSQLVAREDALLSQTKQLIEKEEALDRARRKVEEELTRVTGLTKDQARDGYLQKIEAEFRDLAIRRAKEVEVQTASDLNRQAKKVLLTVIQRTAVDYLTEASVAIVDLPNEEMKGRLIGREGRNIRAFEQVTGVDLIIDETPEAVVISCFEPVRREIARVTLINLMMDGRIHPGRIEELHERATAEVNRVILEAGERAAERANVTQLPPRVIEMMGRLRFRTSYAQNVLDHSVEVARLAEGLAHELGLNAEIAKRSAFLHDIGKALGPEFEGPHALTGMEFLRTAGERESILHAVGAHHYEIEPTSPEAILVIIADSISAARPGARRESLDNYIKRLGALEAIANGFDGVERSYAVQAGREVRLIVRPTEIDDLAARRLAIDVARRIENELDFPGQIKVTVIRETRVTEIAK
jgi:ribonuclease Y